MKKPTEKTEKNNDFFSRFWYHFSNDIQTNL